VVVRINGFSITNPDEALAAYDKLRDAKTFRIEVRRQGRPKRLTYRLPR
jgi:type II secretory pathway component PulC